MSVANGNDARFRLVLGETPNVNAGGLMFDPSPDSLARNSGPHPPMGSRPGPSRGLLRIYHLSLTSTTPPPPTHGGGSVNLQVSCEVSDGFRARW